MSDPRQTIAPVIGPKIKAKRAVIGPNWFVEFAAPGTLFWAINLLIVIQKQLPGTWWINIVGCEIVVAIPTFVIAFLCAVCSLILFFVYPPTSPPLYNAGCLLVHISIFGVIIYFKFVLGPGPP